MTNSDWLCGHIGFCPCIYEAVSLNCCVEPTRLNLRLEKPLLNSDCDAYIQSSCSAYGLELRSDRNKPCFSVVASPAALTMATV